MFLPFSLILSELINLLVIMEVIIIEKLLVRILVIDNSSPGSTQYISFRSMIIVYFMLSLFVLNPALSFID